MQYYCDTWHLHLTLLLYIPGTYIVHYFCTYLVPPPYTTPVHTWFLHFTLLLYNCYLVPPLYNTTVQYYCTGWYLHWELLLYWLVPSLCNTTYCVHTWYLHRTLLLYIPGTSTVHYYCTGWLAYVLCMTGKSPENKRSNYLKKKFIRKTAVQIVKFKIKIFQHFQYFEQNIIGIPNTNLEIR